MKPTASHRTASPDAQKSVSVIVPARDEAGTIATLLKRIPRFDGSCEVIVIDDNSTDSTWKKLQKEQKHRHSFHLRTIKLHGASGKKAAVSAGLSHATGDIAMILDADLTVDPCELLTCYRLLTKGKIQFVNCTRFVYPQEERAMGVLNRWGNHVLSRMYTLLTGRRTSDTLCGTKAFYRDSGRTLFSSTHTLARFDPFGDFQFLWGAYLLGLKIQEHPVHYRARTYGKSKVSFFRDGWKLIVFLTCAPLLARKNI